MRYKLAFYYEMLQQAVAYMLPRWLVYRCAIRAWAHSIRSDETELERMTVEEMLERWLEQK